MQSPLSNSEIAAVFEDMALLLELQEANPFRVRAYRKAAQTIHDLPEPVEAVFADPNRGRDSIEGIGEDLAAKIEVLLKTGSLPQHEELKAAVPAGLRDFVKIPGLGPKKAVALHRELKVATLEQLQAACEAQAVRGLKGFGIKTEESILKGIPLAAQAQTRTLWADAERFVEELKAYISQAPGVLKLEAGGSFRRGKDTIGDLDFLVAAEDSAPVMAWFLAYAAPPDGPPRATVIASGETKSSMRLLQGPQVDLRVVPEESFGAALQYFTGSQQHNVELRGLAKDRGLKINEWGVFRGEERVAGRTEDEVYASVGLPWIPPELRESRQEFSWARTGKLPKLLELADLKGDLHMHTTASDGSASIIEMAQAAAARGHYYICITDHSPRVAVANGLTAERLLRQWEEIDRINALGPPVLILKGIEVDILEPGGLDLPDEVLLQADWVVASVHFGQRQPREQITKRIVDALAHPAVSTIGHPTGRLLQRRESYAVDLEAVFQAAAKYGKTLELNAHPSRLDLDDVACAAAKRHGVPIVINSDAHSISGLDVLRYGVLQARRAGLTAADVGNARPWAELEKLIKRGA